MENREQIIKKQADNIFGHILIGHAKAAHHAFIQGAKWADEHPINAWHDLRRNPENLPTNSRTVCARFIGKNDGETRYGLAYYRRNKSWDISICEASFHDVIAWKELDIFEG